MPENGPIRVMVVDDHPVVREGIRRFLQHFAEFDVVGVAGDGEAAVRMASEVAPDVIIMDVVMPEKGGVDACREIIDLMPGTGVLMLTASTAPDAVIEGIAAGARGYLLKDSGVEELVGAIKEVAEGRVNLTAEALQRAAVMILKDPAGARFRGPDLLTARETELLRLFCRGLSYAQIAASAEIGESTVRNTLDRVQHKAGAGSKTQMVVWAVRVGLLDGFD